MRIDSHHGFSAHYPIDNLDSILKRNRFEGSILVAEPGVTPDFVKGIVAPLGDANHPKVCGVIHDFSSGEIPAALAELERGNIALDVLHGLPLVPEIAQRYPKLRLVIDNLGFPPNDDWPNALERAARFSQVHCKLSGLMRFAEPRPYVQHALALFGPRRLMFGSDWPNALPVHGWKENLAVFTQSIGAQSIEVREELLGGTALRFYQL